MTAPFYGWWDFFCYPNIDKGVAKERGQCGVVGFEDFGREAI